MEPWIPKSCTFWRHRKVLAPSAEKPGAGIFAGALFDAALAANYLGRRDGLLAPEESTVGFLGADLRAHGLTPRQVAAAFDACISHRLLAHEGDRIRIVGYDDDWRPTLTSTERSRAHRDRERQRERNGPATPVQRDATLQQRSGNANATQLQRECNGSTGTSTDSHPSICTSEAPRAREVTARQVDGWMDGEKDRSREIDEELRRLAMWDVAADTRAHVASELALAGVTVEQLRRLHTLAQAEGDAPHALLATWLTDPARRAAALERATAASKPPPPRLLRSTELPPATLKAEDLDRRIHARLSDRILTPEWIAQVAAEFAAFGVTPQRVRELAS
jgi:hypothetical protein